jgi:hypothetical protein
MPGAAIASVSVIVLPNIIMIVAYNCCCYQCCHFCYHYDHYSDDFCHCLSLLLLLPLLLLLFLVLMLFLLLSGSVPCRIWGFHMGGLPGSARTDKKSHAMYQAAKGVVVIREARRTIPALTWDCWSADGSIPGNWAHHGDHDSAAVPAGAGAGGRQRGVGVRRPTNPLHWLARFKH